MFKYEKIDEYQIELTTYCNAACPQCPRTINGGKINPNLKLEHLPRYVIDRAFTPELCARLRQIFFCGSYGDPIMHPEFLDILRDFRAKNPTLWLYMHTNGGAHDIEYWREMAEIIGEYGQVDFNIDGLEDTNHLYRRNTDFNKIISNAESFIKAGGKAVWNFIVFEHNQHQVETAKMLSAIMGFKDFKYRATGRFLNHTKMCTFDEWPVLNKTGTVEYILKPTTLNSYKNRSIQFIPSLRKQFENIDEYFSSAEIECDSLKGNKVAINASGLVLPCNMLNHNLTDARFDSPDEIHPGANHLAFLKDGSNQFKDFLSRYDASQLNIHSSSLAQVFKNKFWEDLVNSWKANSFPERMFECALTCGKKFKKVWDQTKVNKTVLVTGGNRGLGLSLVTDFNGTSVSRNNGYDITKEEDIKRIAQESLNYDVFINNAFDGPPQEPWANFAQVNLLLEVFKVWKEHGKSGHIFNIGSTGANNIVPPEPSFETYRIAKAALEHASKQCSAAFKDNHVKFKTTLIVPDRIDTPLSRSRESWTGNGVNTHDISKFIDYALSVHGNSCIDSVIISCNLSWQDN